ncbi:hypothetical protein Tco_1506095 [Tanacetum coccineum]
MLFVKLILDGLNDFQHVVSELVHTCSTECEQSYAKLKKLYDEQREQLSDASVEIKAYDQGLKKVDAQLVTHQQNQLWYEQKIKYIKIDLDDKTDVLTYHKKLLAEIVKEKEELQAKLGSFETSSKILNTLLNSQLSVNDKAGFRHNGVKESKVSETITSVSKAETSNSETSNDKVEIPKIKTVRMSEPINKEWESDSEDDEIVVKPKEVTKTVKPSCEKIESINARKETVRQAKNPRKNNKRPKGNKRNWNGMMTHKLVRTAQPRTRMNDAMQKPYSYYKAYSSVKRPFNKKTTNYNRYFNKRVNTVKSTRVHSARPNAEVNTVKALASWVWKLKHEDLDNVSKSNSASKTLIRYDYVDALGRKREVSHVFLVWFGHTKEMKESPKVGLGCLMSKRKAESKLGLVDVENDTEGLGEDASKQRRIDDAYVEATFIDETLNDARNKNNKISNSKVEDDKETALEVKKCLDISSW